MIIRRGAFYADWIFAAGGIVRSSVIGFAIVCRGRCRVFVFYRLDGVFLTAFFCLDGAFKIIRLFIGCCAVITGLSVGVLRR